MGIRSLLTAQVALKDHLRETRLFQSRVILAGAVCVLFVILLIIRLIYLQVIGHEHFDTLSHENRVNILPLPPTRGLIYDRNGVLLAQNTPSFNIEIVPEQVKSLQHTLDELKTILPVTDDDLERFHKTRKQKLAFESIPLLFQLSDSELSRFAINRHRFPGVDIVARLNRNYPLGSLAVHALGYVGRISEEELRIVDVSNYAGSSHIGKIGIEQAYEDVLHGQVGVRQVEVNAIGRMLREIQSTPPKPGKNLILTLDTNLQRIAEESMEGRRGAVVAIEPRTGDILAFVSTPTYNPNLFVKGINSKTYKELRDSPDQPLYNRAMRGQYPPGSTVKPFVALAGLESGEVTSSSKIFCGGAYMLRGGTHRYRDWKRGGHGATEMTKAIAESCDVYFYDLAQNLGIDAMQSFLHNFGFGQPTGIDIKGELTGILPSREWKRRAYKQAWYPGETLIVGIGQGYFLSTPLQLAHATATLANRGTNIQPRLVKSIYDPNNQTTTEIPPVDLGTINLKNTDHWDQIITAMTEVVHSRSGTAHKIGKDAPYIIAGKTGTAQVFTVKQDERYDETKIDERLKDHALFVAYAPVEDPKIAIAIIVENGGSGSGSAAPIARRVMDAHLAKGQAIEQLIMDSSDDGNSE